MVSNIQHLKDRMDKLERQKDDQTLVLVELLSNASFFGEIKKTNCQYAKNGQCGFFIIEGRAEKKIPIVTDCRIDSCPELALHSHIELSSITCSLCQEINTHRSKIESKSDGVPKTVNVKVKKQGSK